MNRPSPVRENRHEKQWRVLEILSRWGGHGTIEVETQFGGYDFGDTEAAEAKGFRVTRLVVAGIVRSLVRRGYADDERGYDITDKGREVLAQRARRKAKTT